MVSIPACHAGDRGSIPRRGGFFIFVYIYIFFFFFLNQNKFDVATAYISKFVTHSNKWPRGLTDKASDFESEDCEFESRRGRFFLTKNIC